MLNLKMTHSEMTTQVLKRVSIPEYFYNVIVPQLGSYYDNYPVDFDGKIVVCCPLHDEDTPSCRYYEETNTFYCFGCQRGGNVIKLHQFFAEKMNGEMPDDETAVSFLYQYFIAGKETTEFIVGINSLPNQEKLNTDAEIVRFNYYRINLENSISFDPYIVEKAKRELWSLLDIIDTLLDKDMINAVNAEKFVKMKVREITANKENYTYNINKEKVSNKIS